MNKTLFLLFFKDEVIYMLNEYQDGWLLVVNESGKFGFLLG